MLLGLNFKFKRLLNLQSAEQGAQTILQLTHSKETEGVTGKTFLGGMMCPKPLQLTEEFCQKLWKYSIEYTKLQPHEIKC